MTGRQQIGKPASQLEFTADDANRKSLHNLYDHEQLGVMDKDRRWQKFKLSLMIITYIIYIAFGGYILFKIYTSEHDFIEYLDQADNFPVYVIFLSAIILVKLSKLVFSLYEFCLWSDKSVNPLEKNLHFRLWFQMILAMFEVLCFLGTVLILNNTKLGYEMFHYQETDNL